MFLAPKTSLIQRIDIIRRKDSCFANSDTAIEWKWQIVIVNGGGEVLKVELIFTVNSYSTSKVLVPYMQIQ